MEFYNRLSYEDKFLKGRSEAGREFPGSFKMERVELGGTDIAHMIVAVSILESLDSAFLYGEVRIKDIEGMLYNDRIFGYEDLRISISDAHFITHLKFKCYKIGNRERTNQQTQEYTIYFCAEELFYSQYRKISKAYTNMKSEDIIVDMFKDVFPTPEGIDDIFYFAESFEEQNMIIPNWDLAKAVNFISGRTISVDEKLWSNTYKFWQTIDGIYNFFPLEGLLNNKKNIPFTTLVYDPLRLKQSDVVSGDPSSGNRIFAMEDMIISNSIDHLININQGMYANRASIIDITQREMVENDYDYIEEFDSDENQHLAPSDSEGVSYPLMNRHFTFEKMNQHPEQSCWTPVIKSKSLFTADVSGDAQKYLNSTFHKRKSKNAQLGNFSLQATLPGHIGLMAGMIVKVSVPLPNNILAGGGATNVDHDLSGEYLVKNVARVFTLNKMEIKVTLVKDNVGRNV